MVLFFPDLGGDGAALVIKLVTSHHSLSVLGLLFACRLLTTLLCFGSNVPGGIMMPLLALGAVMGAIMHSICTDFLQLITADRAVICLIGMAALFASTIRAPVTALVLVMETTSNYNLLLPLLVCTLSSVMVAQAMGGRPLDSWLLQQSLVLERAIADKRKNQKDETQ